jgi:two-component system, chemotaxis family, response regulator Rcp1
MKRILLVEDLVSDALLTREALAESGVEAEIDVVDDGAAALERLHGDHPRPDLVLLDLNLPGISGREVLEEIKGTAEMAAIPVVVLTTSIAPEDIRFAYEHHANAYVRKPNGFHALQAVTDAIRDFWERAAVMPVLVPS